MKYSIFLSTILTIDQKKQHRNENNIVNNLKSIIITNFMII